MNHWGMPVDYRDPKETYKRNIVERYHFTPEIEPLQKGSTVRCRATSTTPWSSS